MSDTPKHLYLCVDEDGSEYAFCDIRPKRSEKIGKEKRYWCSHWVRGMELPKGSIEHITGQQITWKDKPIKWRPMPKQKT